MKLIIGNKNYSSWSIRPWLVLTHFAIPFDEQVVMLSGEGWRENLRKVSPSGKVPVLIDGDVVVYETIAIIEYLAERFPHKKIWPADRKQRAVARSAAAEMHAGFSSLRNLAPVNLKASYPNRIDLDAVAGDLKRVEHLWGDLLQKSGGPYLFEQFSAADAMFAPLASRIRTYELPTSDVAAEYVEAIYALPAFQQLLADARKETWVVQRDEIDYAQGLKPVTDFS
ncbi:MAG: glutathione S-transferase family protein [Devosia sp.]|jgi:glutathione S-transferase|uniref:glutathione S-transferase family protein n=1 Tax=Devosia sp. TaxID=1871048 RepID=UPI0037C174BD